VHAILLRLSYEIKNGALPEAPLHPLDGLLLLSPFSMNVFDPLYFSYWARGATMVAAPPP
jgi:hypothetical protein